MQRKMVFSCLNKKCGDFKVVKEKGQGYAENQECYFRSYYTSREDFQKQLNEMCKKCLHN